MRVLIVDDQAVVRKVQRMFWERKGHEVLDASSVFKAIEILETTDLDVVVTDLIMPDGQWGTDLARIIKEKWPVILVVLVTGTYHSPHQIQQVKEANGLFEMLLKPLRLEPYIALIERLEQVIN